MADEVLHTDSIAFVPDAIHIRPRSKYPPGTCHYGIALEPVCSHICHRKLPTEPLFVTVPCAWLC